MIKYISLINIQGYESEKIEFPKTGVVRIYGENSAGKTALFKPFFDVITGNVFTFKNRKSLINRSSDHGIYEIGFWTGYVLTLLIHREAASCKLTLTKPDGTYYERAMRDKPLPDLLQELGLHYNIGKKYSLHIYRANTPALFAQESETLNYSALEECLSDNEAITAIEVYEELLTRWKELLKSVRNNQLIIQGQLDTLAVIDEEEEQKKIDEMRELLEIEENIYIPVLPTIQDPNMEEMDIMFDFNFNKLVRAMKSIRDSNEDKWSDKIPILSLYTPSLKVKDSFDGYFKFMSKLEEQYCPTCGRGIITKNQDKVI